ncbi:hypothetical protein MMC29_003693 [Sticta canariensis]|nr:hypothetical protein [Sticta canariensis]
MISRRSSIVCRADNARRVACRSSQACAASRLVWFADYPKHMQNILGHSLAAIASPASSQPVSASAALAISHAQANPSVSATATAATAGATAAETSTAGQKQPQKRGAASRQLRLAQQLKLAQQQQPAATASPPPAASAAAVIAPAAAVVNPFARSNRLGIATKLHKIAVIRAGDDVSSDIVGLTYHIGRHHAGLGDAVFDVLQRMCKTAASFSVAPSLLITGPRQSGKTNLLREIAHHMSDRLGRNAVPLAFSLLHKLASNFDESDSSPSLPFAAAFMQSACCSELFRIADHSGRAHLLCHSVMRLTLGLLCRLAHRVVVIDTSNQIGGHAPVPHSLLLKARRVSVPTHGPQWKAIAAAVQDHVPEVLVIDEVSTKAEAAVLADAVKRGVIVVAGTHAPGLQALLQDEKLRMFVGGVEPCVVEDSGE